MSEKNDDDFDDDLDENLDEEEPVESKVPPPVSAKTPQGKPVPGGQDLSLFFTSTVGPGEKKQKLLVNTGNSVSDVKQTVGNMFGLNPADFHLSHGGVTLDENKPFNAYKMKDGDTVLLIPASSAG